MTQILGLKLFALAAAETRVTPLLNLSFLLGDLFPFQGFFGITQQSLSPGAAQPTQGRPGCLLRSMVLTRPAVLTP